MKKNPFAAMQSIGRSIALYGSIQQVLSWDHETYMPSGALDIRSDQTEALSSLIHKQKTSPSFKKALSKLCDLKIGQIIASDLSFEEHRAVTLWHKEWQKDTKLPAAFVKEMTKATSAALPAWMEAKESGDFNHFAPHLQKLVSLCQKQAKLLGYKEHPYDALLDHYEPEMTTAKLIPLFTELKASLTHLLQKIQNAPQQKPLELSPTFNLETQMQVGKDLLKALGFSEKTSRLDLSVHPFCIGVHPTDTRMTSRVFKESPLSHIFSVLHESGHGLYNQQLPLKWYGTPLCEALSYGFDESQSRFWETLIGRSKPFWTFFYPTLQKAFPQELSSISLSDFYLHMNTVEPSFIRVEADEVTYCLHIIVRFELEKALIEGSLKVKDIPSAWNKAMQECLGICPQNDKEGCLQDVHWSIGAFGYFPTYALGNLMAAQIHEAIKKADPNLENQIEQGQFSKIRNWLKEHIHQHGKLFSCEELIQKITQKPLSASCYIRYLETKYKEIYKF